MLHQKEALGAGHADRGAQGSSLEDSVFNNDSSDTEAHCYAISAALATPSNVHTRSRAAETPGQSDDATVRARRLSDEQSRQVLMGDNVLSRALCGDRPRNSSGESFVAHPIGACSNPAPDGGPCWSGLWSGGRGQVRDERSLFLNRSQESRSSLVFDKLQSMITTEGADKEDFRFFAHGREVCRHTFLLANPISDAQLFKLQARIRAGRLQAHEKHEFELASLQQRDRPKRLSIIGWYAGYAATVGDYMPDEQEVIVPRRERKDEYGEYRAALYPEHAEYNYFAAILREAEELSHIRRARQLVNFQACTRCVDLNAQVTHALKSGNRSAAEAAKALRISHIRETRDERLAYYGRREKARDPSESCVSIILDKSDSKKTTSPWFAQSPGAWWSAASKECLTQHLLGVLVHGRPNRSFLYAVNDSIKGDANLNVEGLRRTLASMYAQTPMPRTLYVQGDNASDNKCWTVVAFLAMLVFHGYTKEAFLSFLIVGHTHEDIDQLFSVISRYFRKLRKVATPQQFLCEVAASLQGQQAEVSSIEAVLQYDTWLRPSLVHPLPIGLQHAVLPSSSVGSTVQEDEVRSAHTFWIHKRTDGVVVFHYKELCADPVWLPHKQRINDTDALVMDPEGIVLFREAPPDPMISAPSVAEFAVF